MWVQLPYQRQEGDRQYVEAHWGEAQTALELLEALNEEYIFILSFSEKLIFICHLRRYTYTTSYKHLSIINLLGLALPSLK